jgi:protein kinase
MHKFKMAEVLGDGTYGIVYKGYDTEKNEIVAIKKLKTKIKSWQECIDLKEIKSLSKLKNHNNIIKLREVIREPNSEVFFIFEFAEHNLYQIMENSRKSGKEFSEKRIKQIIYQIASGLNYMHNNGYFHRDLKPENILLNNDVVKIADFGLARELANYQPMTDYVCTRWYRAPECILKSSNYSAAMDIWALGAIMAELYILRPIFPGSSEFDQLTQIVNVLGTPKLSEWPEGYKLVQKIGLKFPLAKGYPLEQVIPNASSSAIKLLYGLLCWDPQRRITASQILNHNFFDDIVFSPKKPTYSHSNSVAFKFSNSLLNNSNSNNNVYNNNSNYNNTGDVNLYMNNNLNNYIYSAPYNTNSNNHVTQTLKKDSNNFSRLSYLAQNELNINNQLGNIKYPTQTKIYKNNKIEYINTYSNNDTQNNNIDEQNRKYGDFYSFPIENKNYPQNNMKEFSFPLPFTYFKY